MPTTHDRHDHGRIASSDRHRQTATPDASQTIRSRPSRTGELDIGQPSAANSTTSARITS
jgi:hypothetical protein